LKSPAATVLAALLSSVAASVNAPPAFRVENERRG